MKEKRAKYYIPQFGPKLKYVNEKATFSSLLNIKLISRKVAFVKRYVGWEHTRNCIFFLVFFSFLTVGLAPAEILMNALC